MTKVSIVGPDEAETISLGPATEMQVLEDGSTTDRRLGIVVSTIAGHTPGPPQHRHADHDEGFYVISGLMVFTVGDRDHEVTAGTLVMVPPSAPHTFANPTEEPATFLTAITPDLYVPYFRELSTVFAAGEFSRESQEKVMAKYGTVFSDVYADPADR